MMDKVKCPRCLAIVPDDSNCNKCGNLMTCNECENIATYISIDDELRCTDCQHEYLISNVHNELTEALVNWLVTWHDSCFSNIVTREYVMNKALKQWKNL